MAKNRNTKLALASLMAVSAIAPVVASADTNGSVTTEAGTSRSAEAANTSATVTLDSLKNGEYYVSFTTLKPGSTETSSMGNHIGNVAKLIVKDGKYTVQLTIAPESNPMVSAIQSTRDGKLVEMDLVSGGRDQESRVVSFPITSLQDKLRAHVVVEVPANPAMPKGATMPHDFDIAFGEVKTEAPVKEDKPEAEKPVEQKPTTETTNTTEAQGEEVPVYVYKDGEKELSIMAGVYLSNTATVTDKGIDVVFPQGQYLKGFEVEGVTVALKSEEVVGDNTVKVYTIQTKDESKIYTATVDVKVNVSGVSYDTKHKVQLQFGGKQNPFTDIQKLDNYSAIVNLYSAGIFKENEKFNPHNPTTRSQFSLMLYRALKVEAPATTAFKDIAKLDAEAQSAIKALNNLGVINGVNKETFAPYNNITRAQTAKMIYRLLVSNGYKDQANAVVPFSDVTANDAELNKAAAQLNALGIMTGSNGKLNPNAPLTRNQMAKVLNNALEVLEGLK